MKKLDKIVDVYNKTELKLLDIEQQELWLRSKIAMQFIYLREKKATLNKK